MSKANLCVRKLSRWRVWPVAMLLAAAVIFRLANPELPRVNSWSTLARQNEIAAFRSKVIAASQMTRAVFARIKRPAGPATLEESDLLPVEALALTAQTQGVSVDELRAELEGERTELSGLSEDLELRRVSDPKFATAWAALQCLTLTRIADIHLINGRDLTAVKSYQAILTLADKAGAPMAWCDAAQTLQFVLAQKGRMPEAEPLARHLVELRMIHQGPTHLETLASLTQEAIALYAKGNTEKAMALFNAVLSSQESILGKNHPDNLLCLTHLRHILKGKAEYDRAITLCRRALRIRETTLGRDHPDTLKNMNDLGLLVWFQSDRLGLNTLEERGLEMAGFPSTAQVNASANQESAMAQAKEGYIEAEFLFRRAISACEQRFGANDRRTLVTLNNLGGLVGEQGRLEEAKSILERAMAGMMKISTEGDPKLLEIQGTLARLREQTGTAYKSSAASRRAAGSN